MSEQRSDYTTERPIRAGQSYITGGSGPVPAQIPDAVHYEAITTDDMACAVAALTGCDVGAARAELRAVIARLAQQVTHDWPEWKSGEA